MLVLGFMLKRIDDTLDLLVWLVKNTDRLVKKHEDLFDTYSPPSYVFIRLLNFNFRSES